MEQAKSAVNKIIGRSGHHDTEVHENVRPAVTQETIKPHRHEETQQAIDREVHQDHYHTTVQPLQHKEVLPEKHQHQVMPTQEREFTHGDHEKTRASVQAEAAQFRDTQTTHQTSHSTSQAATAAGEHVHHHVHETVQPIIHKETVQPEVVHTTVPVHEVHHAQAEHHGMSTLPTKSLDEFNKLGGKVTGSSQRHEEYEGHPRPYNPSMQQDRSAADRAPAEHDGMHGRHGTGHASNVGATGSNLTSGTSDLGSAGHTGTTGHTSGVSGTTGLGSVGHTGTTGHTSNVSGTGNNLNTGSGYTSGQSGLGSAGHTGTALGGRAEGNTVGRAVETAASHGTTGAGSHSQPGVGVGTTGTNVGGSGHLGRGVGHSATDTFDSTGAGYHHDTKHADTPSSTNLPHRGGSHGVVGSDTQTPSQGRDPSLVESGDKGTNLRGSGVDGSHSAVFGLTPDGHVHDDTKHGADVPAVGHNSLKDRSTTGDAGSRAPTGSGVAGQMNDPNVLNKGHGGPSMTSDTSGKPGAGESLGGQQGFGQVRPNEHGAQSKLQNKLDPTTDSDRDGKRGVMD